MQPDAIIYTINELHLNSAQQRRLAASIDAAGGPPWRLVRLQGTGQALGRVLDDVAAEGHGVILVQPLGLPFSQSLAAWLPGALAHWLQEREHRADRCPRVLLGDDQSGSEAVMAGVISDVATAGETARRIDPAEARLGKPGWQEPPAFKHHLLVCSGPRCHFRDAADLRTMLKEALIAAGADRDCLLATTGCLFPCNRGPIVAVYPRGEWYRLPDQQSVERFVSRVLVAGESLDDLLIHTVPPPEPAAQPPETGRAAIRAATPATPATVPVR
ncbi:(2Fe-2S) ferredoxin domain-containing protein [Fodinicurvata sp. EGI_FJ10296]|uniref:(2Fe-2S) ferredoxin domain-containing protein n=1 Tax=Fodinicurvata sp. EGI_FJ10296 TaxID=3231908 RepID=UPI003454BF97